MPTRRPFENGRDCNTVELSRVVFSVALAPRAEHRGSQDQRENRGHPIPERPAQKCEVLYQPVLHSAASQLPNVCRAAAAVCMRIADTSPTATPN